MIYKFLEINLRGSKASQNLMHEKAANDCVDFILASELYNVQSSNCYPDANKRAAIINVNRVQTEDEGISEPGFRWITVDGLRIYSCYWSPSTTYQEYQDFLSRLENSIRTAVGDVLVTGDFKAHHSDWGSRKNDRRGDALSDLVHATGMVMCNVGNHPTFRTGSIIDITFATPYTAHKISNWAVLDEETLSDHSYIRYDMSLVPGIQPRVAKNKIDYQKLNAAIDRGPLKVDTESYSAEDCATLFTSKIHNTCTVLVSEKSRRSVHWWSPALGELRKTVNHLRRVYQRKKKRLGPAACASEETEAKLAKSKLVRAIKIANDEGWKRL